MTTSQLTSLDHSILELLAQGLPNKQIADRLGMGYQTVKNHMTRLMREWNAQSRTELAVKWVRVESRTQEGRE